VCGWQKETLIEDISFPANSVKTVSANNQESRMKTIHENERDYIIDVLKKCNGRLWGSDGAAKVLNIPPSTLKSKMKKLGIKKPNFE
jgi:transcriptional regulator with GAF, ATPase, and Fis domain